MLGSFHQWALDYAFLGVPAWRLMMGGAIALVGSLTVFSSLRLMGRALSRRQLPAARALGAAAKQSRWWLILTAFLVLGAQTLGLSGRAERYLGLIGTVAIAVQIGLWANSLVRSWTVASLTAEGVQSHNPVVLAMMSWFARIMVWATLLLAALSVAGINITAFVASLGVGGVVMTH